MANPKPALDVLCNKCAIFHFLETKLKLMHKRQLNAATMNCRNERFRKSFFSLVQDCQTKSLG